jgi:hypothetical protein
MEPERCPRCGEATVVGGSINVPGEGGGPGIFVPNESQAFASYVWVRTSGVYHACASCGHVWSSLDPAALRKFIQAHGKEVAKQQLDEFDHGPNRGLPDTELAHEIAERVAEIDALVRSGKPGAIGRYRDLRGVTWDQAIKETREWRTMKRDEKLALLGWEPKQKEPIDNLDSPYF